MGNGFYVGNGFVYIGNGFVYMGNGFQCKDDKTGDWATNPAGEVEMTIETDSKFWVYPQVSKCKTQNKLNANQNLSSGQRPLPSALNTVSIKTYS